MPTTRETKARARMTARRWIITRDGQQISGPFETETEAAGVLLRIQPHSTAHACEHEGWAIESIPGTALPPEDRPEAHGDLPECHSNPATCAHPPIDLPMGGCATATRHYAHLTDGERLCDNGTDAGEEAVAFHAAGDALRATSDAGLLRTYAALTHQIHAAWENTDPRPILEAGVEASFDAVEAYLDLRAQRDLVEAEVLRRMGGTR